MSTNLNEELGQGRRFIVAPNYLVPNIFSANHNMVILSDYTFWTLHYDELQEWCNVNGGTLEGMTVMFPDEQSLLCFLVRWA